MSETMATCMDLRGRLGRWAFFTNVERPRRVAVAVVAAFVVAEAAVLLLRPRDGVIAPVPVDPRSYFTSAELERARDYRHGQLVLFAAGTTIEVALLVWLVRRPPARLRGPFRRPGARGGGRRRGPVGGLRRWPGSRSAPISHHRAVDVGLSTQDWGPWLGDVAKSTAIGAVFAGVGAAAALALMRRFPRGLVAARQRPRRRLRHGQHLPGPGRPRSDLQQLHGAARGPHARRRAGPRARGEASTSARSTRSTPAGARRPPTPMSPVWGGPSASSSTTTS